MLINQNQKKKIPDISNLVKKSDYNTKVSEIEGKISSISNLATTSALTTVETKIPSTSNLVKKTDYDTKVKEIEKKLTDHKHDKYIATLEFNKLAVMFLIRDQHKQIQLQRQTLMLNYPALIEKLLQIKQDICLLKMN